MDGVPEGVSVEVEIGDEETLVRVSGTRDAATIVSSASGEEIYLPPEEFDQPPDGGAATPENPGQSPYEPAGRSPYEGMAPADSPYDSAGRDDRSTTADAEGREPSTRPVGVEPTPEGFRVLHPEPITDLRFVRAD
ncbi:MAG: hypothetical protein ABEH56_03055 [Salinirussus sp.]